MKRMYIILLCLCLTATASAQPETIRYEMTSGKYWGYGIDEVHKIDFTDGVKLILEDGTTAVATDYDGMHRFIFSDKPFETESIKIGTTGISTFGTDKALDFRFVTDAFAYVALSDPQGGHIAMTQADGKVAAETGLYVVGQLEKGTSYTVLVPVTDEGTEYADNKLVAAPEAVEIGPSDGIKYNYVLQLQQNTTRPAFYLVMTPMTVPAKKAYLQLSQQLSKVEMGDEATGINSVNENEDENGHLYNLNGVRVNGNYKGVAIKNGKKYLMQ